MINNTKVQKPKIQEGATCVYYQYVIKCSTRDRLIHYLGEREIETAIHYPIPPHLSEAYRFLGYHKNDFPLTEEYADTILSLPMYNGMSQEEQAYVIDIINAY